MSTLTLRRFSRPEMLRSIQPERLLELLHPYEGYLAARGFRPRDGAIDYEVLTSILLAPASDTPEDLCDALFFIHELATPAGMDGLLEAAVLNGLVIDNESAPADVAVQVWLQDRTLLERKHAENALLRPRTFHHLRADRIRSFEIKMPTAEQLSALERTLDDWFETKKRGRGTRVFVFSRPDEVWFLVRHGEPYRREGALEGTVATSVFYRPEKFDVLVYRPDLGELRVNARSKHEIELYRLQFGQHIFGSPIFFIWPGKYTLEGLRTDGPPSLVCRDVKGIEAVSLVELQFYVGGRHHDIRIFKAADVFAARGLVPWHVPDSSLIRQATFRIKFVDSRQPRSVTIRPPSIAQYTRDSDAALVEEWLVRRGFCRSEGGHGAARLLESA